MEPASIPIMKESLCRNPAGLYIHVPFCVSKCPYCNFQSTTSLGEISDYLRALLKEMEIYRDTFTSFDTVYLGGGTPSLLSVSQVDTILNGIHRNFKLETDLEITIETNPANVTLLYLKDLRTIGVNRLNIGIQSFNDRILRFLGRRHTAAEALSALEAATVSGFQNTGIDLIYGVPGQEMDAWMQTLKTALSFHLPHLSCYQLTIEPGTPLGASLRREEFVAPTEDRQYEFFMLTADTLEQSGYIHYEVSNFAASLSLTSRHNQKYWDHTPYLGLGSAAHSFREEKRWWNLSSVGAYLEAFNVGRTPVASSESLTPEELFFEAIFLGLRTRKGINLSTISSLYADQTWIGNKAVLDKLLDEDILEIADGFLKPTRRGLAIADSLALL